MTEPPKPKIVRAVASADRRSFTLRVGDWRGTFPLEKLDDWIATYRGLAERKSRLYGPGAYRQHYQTALDAMEALRSRLYPADAPQGAQDARKTAYPAPGPVRTTSAETRPPDGPPMAAVSVSQNAKASGGAAVGDLFG